MSDVQTRSRGDLEKSNGWESDGWADYDDNDGCESYNDGGSDGLRRDLAEFKSFKEVLLSHNLSDGGIDWEEPSQTVLLDYEENRRLSPAPEEEDEDTYIDP